MLRVFLGRGKLRRFLLLPSLFWVPDEARCGPHLNSNRRLILTPEGISTIDLKIQTGRPIDSHSHTLSFMQVIINHNTRHSKLKKMPNNRPSIRVKPTNSNLDIQANLSCESSLLQSPRLSLLKMAFHKTLSSCWTLKP